MKDGYRVSKLIGLIRKGKEYSIMESIPESCQLEFLVWRFDVIYQLELFSDFFSDIVAEMRNNNQIDCYNKNFVMQIVAALVIALENLPDKECTVNEQIILENNIQPKEKALNELLNILSKFSNVARQLLRRHNKRETLTIKDEYDVQDLLYALLRIHFDDVRPEVWTPSYAGGSARMDFLLKNEQIVIEVKKTRDNLNDKEVGEQLIIDKVKYSEYQECKTLVCFVYDPEVKLTNPTGLANDLEKMSTDSLKILVKIER
jgi:hypothetical protein